MRKRGWLFFGVVLAMGAVACGSSSGGGSSSYSGTNCPSAGVTSASCVSCLQSKCASQISALDGDCSSSEFDCVCKSGGSPSSCTLSSSCSSAGNAWASCVTGSCASPCGV